MAKVWTKRFKQGYGVGRHWSNGWVPGGPYAGANDAKHQQERADWLAGWRKGVLKSKYKTSHPKVAALIAGLET